MNIFCGFRYKKFLNEYAISKSSVQGIYIDLYKIDSYTYKICFTYPSSQQAHQRHMRNINSKSSIFIRVNSIFRDNHVQSYITKTFYIPYTYPEIIGWFLLGLNDIDRRDDTKSSLNSFRRNILFDRNILKLIIDYI